MTPRRRLARLEIEDFPPEEQYKFIEAWARQGLSIGDAIDRAAWGVMPVAGGATETGEVVLQNVPVAPYELNPARFFQATERNIYRRSTHAFALDTPWNAQTLPSVGILAKITLILEATLTLNLGAGSATTTQKWPYGFFDSIAFTANGQDDLFSCQGLALKVLERARYPYLNGFGDDLTGPGTGAGLAVPNGATTLRLSYELPLAFDESSLVGALFAQSRSLNLALRGRDAPLAQLVTLAGGAALTSMTGTWSVLIEPYQVPVDDTGKMILPDLRFLHGFNELLTPFASTGDVSTALVRVAGSLQRLFVQVAQQSAAPPDFYDPTLAGEIDEYRLEFGGNKRPYVFAPGQALVTRNVRDYGAPLPFRYVCLDLARHNAIRDAINIAGITEAFWITDVDDAAAPTASAHQRVTEETLFH